MHPDPLDDDVEPTAWDRAVQAHEASLTIGARVRTHVSAECHGPPSLASIGMYDGPPRLAHTLPRDDDRIGVIAWIAKHVRLSNDHPYWVNWDNEGGQFGFYYAASELIPWPTPEGVVADALARLEEE